MIGILLIKFDQHQWHYFEEEDSIISQHQSLPRGLEHLIESSKEMRTIELILNEEQVKNYYRNGNFVFKNIKLKTCKYHLDLFKLHVEETYLIQIV